MSKIFCFTSDLKRKISVKIIIVNCSFTLLVFYIKFISSVGHKILTKKVAFKLSKAPAIVHILA
jgi:hypothetical protein